MITTFDKAIAALLGALISLAALLGALISLATLLGLDLPEFFKQPETITTISGLAAGLLTWLVPNKPRPPRTENDLEYGA